MAKQVAHVHVDHTSVDGLAKLADPSFIGPGTWNCFFNEATYAGKSKKESKLVDCVEFILREVNAMRCECKQHFLNYEKEKPMMNAIHYTVNGEHVGLLLWLWGCKNNVNQRLGKLYLPIWTEVYNHYWLGMNINNVPCASVTKCEDNVEAVREKLAYYIES